MAFFSDAFARECQGVLHGVEKHKLSQRTVEADLYTLRRNVHRLEKGLLMRPRREVFGLKYVMETVESYERAVRQRNCGGAQPSHLAWSHDVLRRYFHVCSDHPLINEARGRFEAVAYSPKDLDTRRIPYERCVSTPAVVKFDDLLQLAKRRKSVRWYLPHSVPRELIDKAMTLGGLAPSACNRQPFEFLVFDSPEAVKQVASIPMGAQGFAENIPAIVVVVGKLAAFFAEEDRHLIYVDAALATMQFLLALESLGLSSCCIKWHETDETEAMAAQLLGLAVDERVIMLVGVGYADPQGMVAYSGRKSIDELRRYPDL